jgi:hypothetical protein
MIDDRIKEKLRVVIFVSRTRSLTQIETIQARSNTVFCFVSAGSLFSALASLSLYCSLQQLRLMLEHVAYTVIRHQATKRGCLHGCTAGLATVGVSRFSERHASTSLRSGSSHDRHHPEVEKQSRNTLFRLLGLFLLLFDSPRLHHGPREREICTKRLP